MSINLKIISSKTGEVFREKCHSILFTSQSGEVEVLSGHIPLIANITENTNIVIKTEGGEQIAFLAASFGFFTFNCNECLISLTSCTRQQAPADQSTSQVKMKKAS